MAIIKNNIFTQGLSGAIENMVFRTQGNKTSVYLLSPRTTELSINQKEANNHFKQAVAMAKQMLLDPVKRLKFEEMAKESGKRNAFQAAISFYLNEMKKS